MNSFSQNISLKLNKKVFLKDPESSDLGIKIIRASVDLMDELGYEDFTFKKLANLIKSTEASIYRYFESKHKLLVYLTMWYWGWLEYRLVMAVVNVENPNEQLIRSVKVLTEEVSEDETFTQVNETKLNRIIISESSKVYFKKNVELENELGYFSSYKALVEIVSQIILEIKPAYLYPHMLVSTIIEGSHHQRYFAEHLPRLTDVRNDQDAVTDFYTHLVKKELEINE